MTNLDEKQEFIAKLSHKVRNPLSSILGYADLILMNSDLSDEDKEMLEGIKRNCKKIDRALVEINTEFDNLPDLGKSSE